MLHGYSLSIKVTLVGLISLFLVSYLCVYGPYGDDDRIKFLQELDLSGFCSVALRYEGDFNLICEAANKNNQCLNLGELLLHGRMFTWSDKRQHPILQHIHRVCMSVDWENLFPNCFLHSFFLRIKRELY